MLVRTVGAIMSCALVCIATVAQAAAVDYFLKIDGIEGESEVEGHKGEIEILSWSWGASNRAGDGSVRTFKTAEIVVTKQVDKATPVLLRMMAGGSETGEPVSAVLVARKNSDTGGGESYLKIKLEDVLISSYQTGGSAGDVVPTDQISLNFTKITFEHTPSGEIFEQTPEVATKSETMTVK